MARRATIMATKARLSHKIGRASRMVRVSNMSELVIELVRVFAVGDDYVHVASEAYEFVCA